MGVAPRGRPGRGEERGGVALSVLEEEAGVCCGLKATCSVRSQQTNGPSTRLPAWADRRSTPSGAAYFGAGRGRDRLAQKRLKRRGAEVPKRRAARTTGAREPLVKVSYVNSDREVEAIVWRRRELTGMSDQDVDDVAFLTGRTFKRVPPPSRWLKVPEYLLLVWG